MLRQTVLAYIVRMDINRALGRKATVADHMSAIDIARQLDAQMGVPAPTRIPQQRRRKVTAHA